MIEVKDVEKINEINKNLKKIDECLTYFPSDGGIHKLMLSFKEFYFRNNFLSRKQLECLGKYYNIIQEEWDEMVDESGFYAWEQE
jgi:hypothetical protein